MKTIIFILLLMPMLTFGQDNKKLECNKNYSDIKLSKGADLKYSLHLKKGGVYRISVMQQGIDVMIVLSDKLNNQIIEKDSPNGQNGLETFDYTSSQTTDYYLAINRLDENSNANEGKVSITIKEFSTSELKEIAKIKQELEPENKKDVQTLDIDHFWEAFDNLKKCRSRNDSIASFQKLYLDRATNGLEDFIKARNFTAEKFVEAVSKMPKFYNSIRKNTYEVKKAVPVINEVVSKFKEIYPNFKPFKVCFAIGLVSTGGTVSDEFLLIGTEITTSTKNIDLSEFKNSPLSKVLASGDDVVQKIKNFVSHEYVHTQQTLIGDKNAIRCDLLYAVMQEGFCDFIGELIAGNQINIVAQEYGNKHEKELWKEFKSELCNESLKNWLYNYSTVKDKPADLGYYIGYKIAKEYYENALDKRQAVSDIIQMKDPIEFLQISRYDQKEKN